MQKQLTFPDWMKTPQTDILFDIFGDQIRYVGGCVRNALMGDDRTDLDFACQLTPFDVQTCLEAKDIKVIPTGLDHGTLTAIIDSIPFEITSLREDVETDGRRAVVSFTDDWTKDARRRDFTMNALYADQNGNIYDETQEGLEDLETRSIRFVGDPSSRIAEDYLRILRFFRFSAFYGNGEIDKQAFEACVLAAEKISTLSRERITQEVLKLLSAKQPNQVLLIMNDNTILPSLFHAQVNFDVLDRYHDCNPISRLAILAHFDEAHIAEFEKRMIFSKAQRQDLVTIIKAIHNLSEISENQIKQLIYKFKHDLAKQIYLLFCAKENLKLDPVILELCESWDIPDFPYSGDELISQGYKPGLELGQKLKELEVEWLKTL